MAKQLRKEILEAIDHIRCQMDHFYLDLGPLDLLELQIIEAALTDWKAKMEADDGPA